MNARYLTDDHSYPLDGYLPRRTERQLSLRRDRVNLRPLLESIGWILAGAAIGCAAMMLGAWGLLRLTEPHSSATAMVYQTPAAVPQ
jgi:hypothetical protein